MQVAQQNEHSLFRYLLYLNYLSVIFLGLSYLSVYISPLNFWAISLVGMAYPFLFAINLVFVIFWLSLWKKYFRISAIVLLLGFNLPGKFIQLNFRTNQEKSEQSISILSFNVHNFSNHSETGSFNKETQKSTFDFIETQDADLVCLQEFNYVGENIYASHAQLKQRLGSENYFFENYFNPKKNKVFGLATFSKFPIVNSGFLGLVDTRKFATFIDLIYQADTLRVYNVHLESINLTYVDYSFVSGITSSDSIPKPNTSKLLSKLQKALINRTKQVKILKDHMAKSPHPLILCGDFNELPNSFNYKSLARGLEDAFIQKGSGFGKTFNSKLPAFRIDYILFDPIFSASDYDEIQVHLSDHFPISTKLYLN